MTVNYAVDNHELSSYLEFEAEELKRKLKYSMVNFAQLRFVKSIQQSVVKS